MPRDDDNSWLSTGCTVVLAVSVVIMICGGGLVALVGGGFYLARQQAAEAQRADAQARDQAMIARLEAIRLGEMPLPPGAHAIAIGPDGEIFWDDKQVDQAQLETILETLAPAARRAEIPIHIRPGLGAPEEIIDHVREMTRDYHEVVEPPLGPRIDLAPEPDSEPAPDIRRQK